MNMIAMGMRQPVDPDITTFRIAGRNIVLSGENLCQCQGAKLELVQFKWIAAWRHDCLCFRFKENSVVLEICRLKVRGVA